MSKARFMTCRYCGQTKPMKGWRSVMGVGRCCSDCVEELRQADVFKRQQTAVKDIAAWPDRKAARAPAPAVNRADGVTVCPSLSFDPRYQVDPATRVIGGFATMGVGRYLEVAA